MIITYHHISIFIRNDNRRKETNEEIKKETNEETKKETNEERNKRFVFTLLSGLSDCFLLCDTVTLNI